jgi:hypothetical protein
MSCSNLPNPAGPLVHVVRVRNARVSRKVPAVIAGELNVDGLRELMSGRAYRDVVRRFTARSD